MQQKSEKMLLGFLLALAMVIGLLPCMSLTAYADSADIGVGTTWYVGDTINLGGKYFVKYYHPTTGEPYDVRQSKDEETKVPAPEIAYAGDPYEQWKFVECVKTTSISGLDNISVIRPDDKDASETPIGFRIKSGDGTQKNPYTFELVYAPKINVSLDKTTLSMVVDTNSNGEILTATVSSDETIDKTVEWSSSDDTVVQASPNSNLGDDGYQNLCYVRALKAGTSTITVTATNGTENTSDDKTATCTVKVYDPYPIGTVWHLGDTINLHGAWYLAQNNDQYEQHSKDEDSVVPTSPQLYDAVAVFSEFIPVSGEVSVAGGELLPYTDGRKGTLRIDIPADKKGKTPSGIKLVEGKGTILHPYEFELVFENAPSPEPPTPAEKYTVTFVDGQGKTLKTESVEKGKAATAPAAPTREGYTFDGWDKDFSNITADLTVNARWKESATPTPSKPVSIANAKVVLSASSFVYNGKVRKPSIKTIGGKTLKSGTDYTVKWSNTSLKNVGSYTVTITGKGNYTGVTKVTYKINPKGTSLKTPKKARKAITVKWKRQAAKMSKSRITGYQIQLATDKKFTKNRKTVNVNGYKKTSKKVKKLKAKKKYYIRVRTYKTVSGIKYYSGWSKVKAIKTK